MSGTERYLSAREAADYCGVSERAVRKWLEQGKLSAFKRGRTFCIAVADLVPFQRNLERNVATSPQAGALSADRTSVDQVERSDGSADLVELVRLVRDQQHTITELAGRVGFLQAELQQRDAQLRALQGSCGSSPVSTLALGETTVAVGDVAMASSVLSPHISVSQRSWWRFW